MITQATSHRDPALVMSPDEQTAWQMPPMYHCLWEGTCVDLHTPGGPKTDLPPTLFETGPSFVAVQGFIVQTSFPVTFL